MSPVLLSRRNLDSQVRPYHCYRKEDQITMVKRIITGEDGAEVKRERDHVIFNTGLRLKWFDKVDSYEEGFQLAEALLQTERSAKNHAALDRSESAFETARPCRQQ